MSSYTYQRSLATVRRMSAPATAVLVLLATLGCDETYDVRGPEKPPGFAIRTESRFEMSEGRVELLSGSTRTTGVARSRGREIEDIEVLEAVGHDVQSYGSRFNLSENRLVLRVGGEEKVFEEPDPLLNRPIVHTHSNGVWTRGFRRWTSLADKNKKAKDPLNLEFSWLVAPTDEAKVALAEMSSGSPFGDELLPDAPVAVGARWTFDGPRLALLLGLPTEGALGNATVTLAEVDEVKGEKSARLHVDGFIIVQRQEPGGDAVRLEYVLQGDLWRSLHRGVFDRQNLAGRLVMTRRSAEGTMEVSGPFSFTSFTTIVHSPRVQSWTPALVLIGIVTAVIAASVYQSERKKSVARSGASAGSNNARVGGVMPGSEVAVGGEPRTLTELSQTTTGLQQPTAELPGSAGESASGKTPSTPTTSSEITGGGPTASATAGTGRSSTTTPSAKFGSSDVAGCLVVLLIFGCIAWGLYYVAPPVIAWVSEMLDEQLGIPKESQGRLLYFLSRLFKRH